MRNCRLQRKTICSTKALQKTGKMIMGAGRTMKYPYTVSGKLALFPYQWHWKNGRFVRFLGFTLIGIFPLICKVHRAVHSPGNVHQWEEIRRRREHTHFDPVFSS